jgi:peptidoglycan hydrolase CwlO-like protein
MLKFIENNSLLLAVGSTAIIFIIFVIIEKLTKDDFDEEDWELMNAYKCSLEAKIEKLRNEINEIQKELK